MAETLAEQDEGVKGLPDAEDVMEELLHGIRSNGWICERDDYQRMVMALDGIAPIQAYYLPMMAPIGGEAPPEIKQEWVGLRLPVRSKRLIEGSGPGFTVFAREALEVLSSERPRADTWWRNHFINDVRRKTAEVKAKYEEEHDERAPYDMGYINHPRNEFDEYLVNFETFTFDPNEGVILPVRKYLGALMAHDVFFAETYTKQQATAK